MNWNAVSFPAVFLFRKALAHILRVWVELSLLTSPNTKVHLCGKVVKPLACVYEVVGSNSGCSVLFTSVFFLDLLGSSLEPLMSCPESCCLVERD